MDRLVVSESGGSEGLQDALSLLLGLAKSHLGRTILSQPACISKLLLLLVDQRYNNNLITYKYWTYISSSICHLLSLTPAGHPQNLS